MTEDSILKKKIKDDRKAYYRCIAKLKKKLAESRNEALGFCAEMSAAKSTLQELIDEGRISADEVNLKYRRNTKVQYEDLGVDVEMYMSGG